MRFIMAYSGGKDCTLALDRMIRQGHTPAALFSALSGNFNFKHGIRLSLYRQYEQALGIPVVTCVTDDHHNVADVSAVLKAAAEKYDAQAICTGDIYRRDVFDWNRMLADRLGLSLSCPLWETPSEECLKELLDRGFVCYIKALKTDLLPEHLLGRRLDPETVREIREAGVDVCGEDGEYHSITTDGPIFQWPLHFQKGNVIRSHGVAMLDLKTEWQENL